MGESQKREEKSNKKSYGISKLSECSWLVWLKRDLSLCWLKSTLMDPPIKLYSTYHLLPVVEMYRNTSGDGGGISTTTTTNTTNTIIIIVVIIMSTRLLLQQSVTKDVLKYYRGTTEL